jgi:hypothetical protein
LPTARVAVQNARKPGSKIKVFKKIGRVAATDVGVSYSENRESERRLLPAILQNCARSCHFFLIVNCTRTVGSAVFAHLWTAGWVYVTAPLLGMMG